MPVAASSSFALRRFASSLRRRALDGRQHAASSPALRFLSRSEAPAGRRRISSRAPRPLEERGADHAEIARAPSHAP
jgi:hypothetical protein